MSKEYGFAKVVNSCANLKATTVKYRFTLDQISAAQQCLDDHGYCVIDDVVPPDTCDTLIKDYAKWWSRFGKSYTNYINHILQQHSVGQLEPSWKIRLMVKKVFAALFGTEKLLTSCDGIAIAEPPELGRSSFAGKHKLHLDQGPARPGFHAYQGAVYLEEQTADDWCFQVLSESHKHFEAYYNEVHTNIYRMKGEFLQLTLKEVRWFLDQGCEHLRIPVGKGSILLWDSRLVHDGAAPVKGRANKDKWRHVTFVSMTPAKWATENDMRKKRLHYKNMLTTKHWSSLGVSAFRKKPSEYDLDFLPEVALSDEVKLLMGVEQYDMDDGTSNGPEWIPVMKKL